jgi:hypothetical protein
VPYARRFHRKSNFDRLGVGQFPWVLREVTGVDVVANCVVADEAVAVVAVVVADC